MFALVNISESLSVFNIVILIFAVAAAIGFLIVVTVTVRRGELSFREFMATLRGFIIPFTRKSRDEDGA